MMINTHTPILTQRTALDRVEVMVFCNNEMSLKRCFTQSRAECTLEKDCFISLCISFKIDPVSAYSLCTTQVRTKNEEMALYVLCTCRINSSVLFRDTSCASFICFWLLRMVSSFSNDLELHIIERNEHNIPAWI